MGQKHFALYLGNNDLYHITGPSNSNNAVNKSIRGNSEIAFIAQSVKEYLVINKKKSEEIEVIAFLVCPYSVSELIYRADCLF